MAQATNPRGPLILIVDDAENVLEIATEFVQRLGYNAVVASNGADALNILRRNQDVTVLFSDINMPGMDGEELARAAVAARPGLRVILTSGPGDGRLQPPLSRSHTGPPILSTFSVRNNEQTFSARWLAGDYIPAGPVFHNAVGR